MSRLDRHVAHVQNKLAMHKFVNALAWAALGAAGGALIVVCVWRFLGWAGLPPLKWWLMGAGVVSAIAATVALWQRPDAYTAAVVIDQELGLQEKFSTALAFRQSPDPFAQAAVRDAEVTADNVQLQRRFGLRFPKLGYGVVGAFALVFVTAWLVGPRERAAAAEAHNAQQHSEEVAKAKQLAEKAMAVAETLPPTLAQDAKIKAHADTLANMLKNQKFDDPASLARKAQEVLQDTQKALADEAAKVEQRAMAEERTFAEAFGDPADYKTPEVKKVEDDLKKGKFDQAVKDFSKTVDNFDKMTPEEKEKLAKDIEQLAKRLENKGEDPKVQQDIEKKLQEMGVSQQQAQQMAQQMQKAAQGDKQAQQQLAQQAQQMQQQLQNQIQQLQQQANQANQQAQQQIQQLQQQQQQIQQAMQGMQGQANAQAQAQQMAQAAQQMAQAMQQQAQNGQQAKPGQNGQQGNPQASAQQMAQAQAQMQQAMQGMQAAQADAAQVAAAQANAMKQAGQKGQGGQGQNGQNGGGDGEGPQAQAVPGDQGKGEGEWQAGDPNQNRGGNGPGGPGIANGGQTRAKAAAGFDVKTEHDIGEENEKGKILANMMIKDNQPIKGSSKVGLAQVTESVQKQASDEVDEDHVSGQSRKAAEEYFRTMRQDVQPPAPAK